MSKIHKKFVYFTLCAVYPIHANAFIPTIPACLEISSSIMNNMKSSPGNIFSDNNFIKLSNGNAFLCMAPHSHSSFDASIGAQACGSTHTIIKTRNNRISDIIKCNDDFYSIGWNTLPLCNFGPNIKQPKAYYLAFDFGDDRHVLTQNRSPDTFHTRPTFDGHNATVIETLEYDLCRLNINDVCLSPTNNRVFPVGFSASVSYAKATEINPNASAILQTPSYIKTVKMLCINGHGNAIWSQEIKSCIDDYELKNQKCVKKAVTTQPTAPSIPPKEELPQLPAGPKIDTPGATVQNPIGIATPSTPVQPVEQIPQLPQLDNDIEIPDEDILIEDILFENLDANINIAYLDIDGKPCNSKPGAYWNVSEKQCICIDTLNTKWDSTRSACVETEQQHAQRLANEAAKKITNAKTQISQSVSTLQQITTNMDISKWRTSDGKFNTARLASDSIAGVVLGTTGGLITSHIVKKNQLKNGFEDIKCVIGGQTVAAYSDEFSVGIK